MNMNRVVEILRTEKECVERQDTPKCNRDCGNCDLLLPTEKVKQAYTLAIGCIEGTQNLLDEIRAEIASYGTNSGMLLALEILDKYRESEVQE